MGFASHATVWWVKIGKSVTANIRLTVVSWGWYSPSGTLPRVPPLLPWATPGTLWACFCSMWNALEGLKKNIVAAQLGEVVATQLWLDIFLGTVQRTTHFGVPKAFPTAPLNGRPPPPPLVGHRHLHTHVVCAQWASRHRDGAPSDQGKHVNSDGPS